MAHNRPAVPESVKRQLRQEAGFGCCKCSLPIYEYQHIVPYATEPHFRPEDMMILCPLCHSEATLGAMTEEEQRRYKSHPHNLTKGYVDGKLKVNQDFCAIIMGENQFVGDGSFLQIDGAPLLVLELSPEGQLQLSVNLYDEQDNLLALIEKNEWISGDPLPWDLESRFQFLKIRKKLGGIALEIDARTEPIQIRADLWRKQQNIRLDPQAILINGVVKNVSSIDLCFVGLRLVIDTKSNSLVLQPDPRYGEGMFVSWPDVDERMRRGRAAWLELQKRKPGA
jgi:hypothetical protein